MRLGGLVLLCAALSACAIHIRLRSRPEPAHQKLSVGPLSIDAVVYKPNLPPLSEVLKKVPADRYRRALDQAGVPKVAQGKDATALTDLAKRGAVPVLVDVRNTGSSPVDLRALRMGLGDDDAPLKPAPDAMIPRPEVLSEGYAVFVAYELSESDGDSPADCSDLLFHPVVLAPGRSCRGLLFFDVDGADPGALKLSGELAGL